MQDQHLAARQQCGIEFEAWVLGRGANQRDGAVLDIGQKAVLLGTIEAVDLVHEQQRPLTRFHCDPGLGEHLLQVGDTGKHRGQCDEAQADRIGQQPRNAGLARTGRAPQDHRAELAGRYHPPDGSLGSGQMLLPNHLAERPRAEAVGEGRMRRHLVAGRAPGELFGKQIGHQSKQ